MPFKPSDHLSSIIGRHTVGIGIPSATAAIASAEVAGWVAPFDCDIVFLGVVSRETTPLPAVNATNFRRITVRRTTGNDRIASTDFDAGNMDRDDLETPAAIEAGTVIRITNEKVGNGAATPASVVVIQYVPSKNAG